MDSAEFKEFNKLVSSRISELLMLHDCVVLPGFGAFIGNYQPSKLHPVTHLIQAPNKQLVFNRNLKTDDGLLVNAIGSGLNISFSEARDLLVEYIRYAENLIGAGERLIIEKVGDFKKDVEGKIVFSPFYEVNFLPESFGLPSLQIQLIARQPVPERRPKIEFENRTAKKPLRKTHARRTLAKVLPALVIGGFLAVNALLPESSKLHVSDFSFFNPSISNKTAILGENLKATPSVRKYIDYNSFENQFSAETAKVYLVAGCYSSESNAIGMVEYLNEIGFDSRILDKTPGGLFRVVYGSYNDISSATEELSQIRKGLNEQAWMLIN